jgi:hypothetical protein
MEKNGGSHEMLRVLSLNLALRPVDIASGSSPSSPSPSPSSKQATVNAECGCFPDYHVYNAHEIRVRGFVHWLSRLDVALQPQILCFQELLWLPMTEYLSASLEKLNYTTGINIDPLSPENQGTAINIDKSTKFKRAGAGLAIYYREPLELRSCGKATFDDRLGADYLCEKGYMWAIFRSPKHKVDFTIMTLHPQAYVALSQTSPPCESKLVKGLRHIATEQITKLGGYPKAIEMVHQKQFAQIAKTLEILKETTSNIMITGDFNVNSFAARAGSKQETNLETATVGFNQGEEFLMTEKILNATAVPLAQPASNLLSWNPGTNLFARSQDSRAPSVYQKIDHTFVYKGSQFCYIDQQIVPLRLRPFPELDLYWTSVCKAVRGVHARDDPVNKVMVERLVLGTVQKQRALDNATQEQKTNPEQWRDYIQGLSFEDSSQLWKGLEFYGFQTKQDLTKGEQMDFGVRQFSAAPYLLQSYKYGDPHPFSMHNAVSDHEALITRFQL